jgi:formamidopyrimidine-DNA glycosylase
MPELPDLQAFSRNLNRILKGKQLKVLTVVKARNLKTPENKLKEALEGSTLKSVERVGKELHFNFGPHVLALHLMLHGQLHLFQDKNENKYPVIELLFDDGVGLAMTDFQGAATPALDPEDSGAPDALSDAANAAYLSGVFQKKRTPVKTILLDQQVIRGIGNAYADEILWDARISPFSAANKIPSAKIKDLVSSIKQVLEHAEKQILKADPEIISGEIRDFMEVHHAKKKETSTGAVIHQKPISSRKTYYTDEQELFE